MRYLLRTIVAACLLTTTTQAQDTGAAGQAAEARQQMLARASQMMQAGDLDGLQKMVSESEDAIIKSQLQNMLLSGYLRAQDYDRAYSMMTELVRAGLKPDATPMEKSRVSGYLVTLASLSTRAGKTDEAMGLLDQAIEQVAPAEGATPSADYLNRVGAKVRALTMQRKSDEAAKLAGNLLEMSRKQYEATPDESAALMALLDALTIASQTASDAEASNALQLEAEALVTSAMEKDPANPMLVQRFASTAMGRLSTLARSDAEAASEALEALRTKFSALGEGNANVAQMLSRYARSLDSIERSIESQLKLAKLVGSEAPAIDAAYWVNGKGMSADDLKGKVVLLDFWAVWCGPCIATFPHLREWNEEYGDKGLQIVGVTRKYNYDWNEQAQRAERIEGEHSDEDEIAMLEQFLAHHELGHPTIVTPQDSNMQSEYAVSGIPHAVLIDRKGVIRMVKVGSGEANAKALHDKIEELLAE